MLDWRWIEVDALEKQEKWNEAKLLLLESWRRNPDDVKIAIRLGFHCWYFLAEDAYQHFENVDLEEMQRLMNEVKDYGLLHFMGNADFLWCFGYMASLYAYYFGEYDYWEVKSLMMLKLAHELCPEDPVYRYSYSVALLAMDRTIVLRHEVNQKLKEGYPELLAVLQDRFPGDELLSDYFKSVWCER